MQWRLFNCSLAVLLLLKLSIAFANPQKQINALPEPVSNNAVALSEQDGKVYLYSFMGLAKNKTWQDVHNKAFSVSLAAPNHHAILPSVPSSLPLKGRLASIATTVNNRIFLFGGYTVAEDHSEISSPDNFEFTPHNNQYRSIAATPIPTDDAVALSYQNRYIYLISGWHNDGNVNLVQVYDTKTDTWQQASPFLGEPVFGHAGGIMGNQLLICDGVGVKAERERRRSFQRIQACYSGKINPTNPYNIDWRTVTHPTQTGRYRMASAGVRIATPSGTQEGVIFMGGSENPYNYNGIGYNQQPSSPSQQVWFYGFSDKEWYGSTLSFGTMDHRGLLVDKHHKYAYIAGGMGANQTVLDILQTIDLQALKLELISTK